MFSPARLTLSVRTGAPLPMLAAAVAVATVFASTPFLIPEIAERYGVSVGAAGIVSLTQVGGFAVMTFGLPRLLAPSSRIFITATAVLVASNTISAALGIFPLLVAVRAFAGGASGVLIWMVWSDAMRSPRSLARISMTAPLTTLIASPLLAMLAGIGDRALYLALAIVALPVLFLSPEIPKEVPPTRRVSPSRSNRVLLVALLVMTFSGASLFIYESVAARQLLGLSPLATSLGFSLNAAGGLAGARLASRHRHPGLWLASAGPAAALTIAGGHAAFFYSGIAWWGFAFWMGVPGVMQMLAARSLEPAERAGDAQFAMAVGRTLAPLLGGGFADADAYTALSLVSGTGLMIAGLAIAGVQEGRDRLPATNAMVG